MSDEVYEIAIEDLREFINSHVASKVLMLDYASNNKDAVSYVKKLSHLILSDFEKSKRNKKYDG